MFDGTEETCWNSDEGDTQFVIIKFEQSIDLSEVRLHSQKAKGGFPVSTIIPMHRLTLEASRSGS